MKKVVSLLAVLGFLTFGIANVSFAANDQKTDKARCRSSRTDRRSR